jgi:hypothetical protein
LTNLRICRYLVSYSAAYISGESPDSSCGRYATCLLFWILEIGLIQYQLNLYRIGQSHIQVQSVMGVIRYRTEMLNIVYRISAKGSPILCPPMPQNTWTAPSWKPRHPEKPICGLRGRPWELRSLRSYMAPARSIVTPTQNWSKNCAPTPPPPRNNQYNWDKKICYETNHSWSCYELSVMGWSAKNLTHFVLICLWWAKKGS